MKILKGARPLRRPRPIFTALIFGPRRFWQKSYLLPLVIVADLRQRISNGYNQDLALTSIADRAEAGVHVDEMTAAEPMGGDEVCGETDGEFMLPEKIERDDDRGTIGASAPASAAM
jgi:hypothetical protein